MTASPSTFTNQPIARHNRVMAKKKWSELSDTQKRLIIIGGVAEAAITVFAARDLKQRSSAGVRGPKALWAASLVVQPFGPFAYLAWGRQ